MPPCSGILTKPDFKRAEYAVTSGDGDRRGSNLNIRGFFKSTVAQFAARFWAVDYDVRRLNYFRTEGEAKPRGAIDLLDVTAVGCCAAAPLGGDGTHFYFELRSTTRRYVLGAKDEATRDRFIAAVAQCTGDASARVHDDAGQAESIAASQARNRALAERERDALYQMEQALGALTEEEERLRAETRDLIAEFTASDAIDAWWRDPKGKMYKPDFKKAEYQRGGDVQAGILDRLDFTSVLKEPSQRSDFSQRFFRLRTPITAPVLSAAHGAHGAHARAPPDVDADETSDDADSGAAGAGAGTAGGGATATIGTGTSAMLDYYVDERAEARGARRSGTIALSSVIAVSVSTQEGRGEHCIELTTQSQTYVLLAPSSQTLVHWCAALTIISGCAMLRADEIWFALERWSALDARVAAASAAVCDVAFETSFYSESGRERGRQSAQGSRSGSRRTSVDLRGASAEDAEAAMAAVAELADDGVAAASGAATAARAGAEAEAEPTFSSFELSFFTPPIEESAQFDSPLALQVCLLIYSLFALYSFVCSSLFFCLLIYSFCCSRRRSRRRRSASRSPRTRTGITRRRRATAR